CSACCKSATVISYVSPSISTPFRPATSISTPRAKDAGAFCTPSLLKPERVAVSLTLKQLYIESPWVWCAKPSNCVPTWPISEVTTSSLLPRVFLPGFMNVRLVCRLKIRVPEKAIPGPSTWLSSITSPVLMSRAPRKTVSGFFIWLPEPRSSPAPHFDGQRSLSGGTFHCAAATNGTASKTAAMRFIVFLLVDGFVQALVVQRPAHRCELVAELAHVRSPAVRVEGFRAIPDLDHGEMVRPVGLLHDFVAHVAVVAAACVAEVLQQADGIVLARRDDIDVGHDVDAAGRQRAVQVSDRERIVQAIVGGAVAQSLELVAKLPGGGGLGVRLVGLLVLPSREENELARPRRVLHHLGAQISPVPAGSVAMVLEEHRGVGLRRRPDLDVGHHVKRRG